MFKNYFKTAWRNIIRNKVYSGLNILGLATGMAVALIIGLWIYYQFSYDRFLPGHEQVYKVGKEFIDKGDKQVLMNTPQPLADALRNDVPGIQYVARTDWMEPHGLTSGDKKIYLRGGIVEQDFLKVFQYHLLKGNGSDVLKDPYSIVLTQSSAHSLFGNEDPINKTVRFDNKSDLKVTGVLEDVPANSTLQFNFLVSYNYLLTTDDGIKANANNWSNYTSQTFVALQPNVSYAQIKPALRKIIAKYNPDEYKESKSVVTLQSLNDWHLYSDFKNGIATGFIDYVKMFSIIGVLVLLIACFNFINLSTARSEERAREVGVRKAIGSLRSHLIMQFLVESVLIVFIAFIVCLSIVRLSLPAFNQLASSSITIPYSSPVFWLTMIGFILITGLLAGSRPAFYLSSFNPVKVLKGRINVGKWASVPRRILVVLQFTCSVTLIISTVIIYQQIQYAKERPAGYDPNRLVMTDASSDIKNNYGALKHDLLQSGVIANVTVSGSPVTENRNYNAIMKWPGQLPGESVGVASVPVADVDYFSTMGMQIREGRNFTGDNDLLNVILNESAAKQLHVKDPVNQIISWGGDDDPVRIIGVVKDALMGSPFGKAEPTLFSYHPDRARVVTYRLSPNANTQQAIAKLTTIFSKYNPSYPFMYKFIDDAYAAKFKLELLVGKLARLFAALAIFISCIGLFGLAAYTAAKRRKEIGIRKVLGASVARVWLLLSKEFMVLVLISCAIASYLAWLFMNGWLQNYEYRTTMSWWIFAAAAAASLLITIITVSFQAVKAALANPVKSLRTE